MRQRVFVRRGATSNTIEPHPTRGVFAARNHGLTEIPLVHIGVESSQDRISATRADRRNDPLVVRYRHISASYLGRRAILLSVFRNSGAHCVCLQASLRKSSLARRERSVPSHLRAELSSYEGSRAPRRRKRARGLTLRAARSWGRLRPSPCRPAFYFSSAVGELRWPS